MEVPLFNGLKHLPCPKESGGATCSTPGCLFGHRSDHLRTLDGAADDDLDDDSRPAKKRQRLNPTEKATKSDVYDPLSPPTVASSDLPAPSLASASVTPSPLKTHSTPPTTTHSSSLSQPHSTNKPATPLKTAASLESTPDSASTSQNIKQTTRLAPSTPTAKPMAAKKLAPALVHSSPARKVTSTPKGQSLTPNENGLVKTPRKAESLNPRHVIPAPALHSVRYQLLKLLHTEMVRLNGDVVSKAAKEPDLKPLLLSDQGLITTALDVEEKIAKEKGPIYRNIMSQTVVLLKKTNVDTWLLDRKQQLAQTSGLRVRGGADAVESKADGPVVVDTGLSANQEIDLLSRLLTSTQGLEMHGYINTPPTQEEIAQAAQAVEWSKNWEQCDRCNARFQVFPERNLETGELTSGGECTHHSGKSYFPERSAGDTGFINKKWRCCTQDVNDSPGCTTTERHVWKTTDPKRLAKLWNWKDTPANDSPNVKKAVAFDCEMGYTVRGMEVLRLTATSWPDGAELVDVLVQPFGHILDPNSQWSGVFMDDLANAIPWSDTRAVPAQEPGKRKILKKMDSPEAARDLLFSHINPNTVLLGHGLENDLNAMRIIHPKIVDTALLYPHVKGLPLRMSLKKLMETHLRRQIQVDTGDGHDSAEDARAAGDLVRLQVMKKWRAMRKDGWRFSEDGILLKPGQDSSSEDSVDSEEGGAKLTEEVPEVASG